MTDSPQRPQEDSLDATPFLRHEKGEDDLLATLDDAPRVPDALAERHPELVTSRNPVDRLMEAATGLCLASALAIRPDRNTDAALLATADAITRVLPEAGRFVLASPRRFAVLLPEVPLEGARALAEEIAACLKADGHTATIGIATHPTTDFVAHEVVVNARKALAHSLFFGPDTITAFDAVSLNISGDREYTNGRMEEAFTEYREALKIDPKDANVLNSIGVCHADLGEYENARRFFSSCMEADPEEVMAVYNMGMTHALENDFETAESWLARAASMAPDTFEILFQHAAALFALGRYRDAESRIEAAIGKRPENGSAVRILADIRLAEADLADAFRLFKQAVRLTPSDAPALSGLGHCFDLKGENPDIAATFCQEAVAMDPENGRFLYRLGRIRLKQRRLVEAAECFDKAERAGISVPEDLKAAARTDS